MELNDIHVFILQLVLYLCIFFFGFLVAIPVGLNKAGFDGHCMLYAEVEEDQNKTLYLNSNTNNCNVPIYHGIFGMIFAGLLMGLYYAYGLYNALRDSGFGSKMFVIPLIPLNAILCVISLGIACMISVGYRNYCDDIEQHFPSCSSVKYKDYNTGHFVSRFETAKAGAWLGFLAYLAQTGICLLRFCRNRSHTYRFAANRAGRPSSIPI